MEFTLLWQKLKEGDKSAFSLLFKSFYADLKAYGIKISGRETLAKEAIQVLFVKIWENRQTLSEVNSVKSYLLRAYRRTLIDLLQAEKKQARQNFYGPSFQISPEEFLIFHQEKKERAKHLSNLLQQLPGNQKEIIYLRFYNQLSYREIAEILDLNYQTVRNYGVKAMRFLEKGLE